MKKSTQLGLLIAALVVGALAAAATRGISQSHPQRRASDAIPELAAAKEAKGQDSQEASVVAGTTLEVIQVPHYTYVRIGAEGQPGTWAAVNSVTDLKVGDPVRVVQAQLMRDFQSSALKRSFDTIYFGVLEGRGQAQSPNAPHPTQPTGGNLNPHAQSPAAADATPVGKVAKAKGALGHTVAEIYASRASLSGKVVRVRAVIVKSVSGVMGKTFLHVRDGSGSEKAADFDLTITTEAQPQKGDTLLFEGKLGVDVDFGAGYKYQVILQDAQLVTE
jgi:hypothetical protein